MRDLTAEHVAEAHRKDLEIQDKYGVKYLTYWYDSERCTGFCLVDAPDAATAAHVHREAHGEIPSEIIPVDLATVEAFLGRISDPRFANGAPVPDMDPGLRAIMVTDIVASTELTTRLGDLAALELVRVHDALVRRGLALLCWTRGKTHWRRDHGRVQQCSKRRTGRCGHPASIL